MRREGDRGEEEAKHVRRAKWDGADRTGRDEGKERDKGKINPRRTNRQRDVKSQRCDRTKRNRKEAQSERRVIGRCCILSQGQVWKWAHTLCAPACRHMLSAGLLPRKNETGERKGSAGRHGETDRKENGDGWQATAAQWEEETRGKKVEGRDAIKKCEKPETQNIWRWVVLTVKKTTAYKILSKTCVMYYMCWDY